MIDCKSIEENLVKLFDTVQEGLFLAMATIGGPWYALFNDQYIEGSGEKKKR